MEFNRYDFQCTRVCLLALIGDKLDRDARRKSNPRQEKGFPSFFISP